MPVLYFERNGPFVVQSLAKPVSRSPLINGRKSALSDVLEGGLNFYPGCDVTIFTPRTYPQAGKEGTAPVSCSQGDQQPMIAGAGRSRGRLASAGTASMRAIEVIM